MQKQRSKQGCSRLSGGRAQVRVRSDIRIAGLITLLLGCGTTSAQLTLPYSGSGSSSSTLFQITQNGTGSVAAFFLNNSSASNPALFVQTSAPGPTIFGKSLATSGFTYGARFEATGPLARGVLGYALSTTGASYGVYGLSDSVSGTGVFGWTRATTGTTYGGYFQSSSASGTGVYGEAMATSGTTYGVHGKARSPAGWAGYFEGRGYFSGNVGIGTTSPATKLDILGGNWDTASTEGDLRIGDATYRLKIGVATGGAGAGHVTIAAQGGVNALSLGTGTTLATQRTLTITSAGNVGIGTTAPTGRLHIESNSIISNPTLRLHETEADLARLEFTNTNTARKWHIAGFVGATVADDRLNFWNSGVGDILSLRGDGTVVATNPSTTAYAFALHGIISSTSPGSYSAAVRGQNNGTGGNGIGVWGSQDGAGWGVYGTSVSGIGVLGYAAAWGVEGSTASTTSNAYGVYGVEPSEGAGHAVYASGTLAATGTKSFQIDHPLQPETHYLNHFCAEGPEPYNLYRGTVVLDAHGEAWVQLPDYFEAINRDPVITLTPVGSPMPNLHVAVEVQNNRFKIAGGTPNKRVFWRVEAIRNDLWVQRYGYQTEQEKEDDIKGKYLHPELYGQPKERGIHYRPEPEPPHRTEEPTKP